MKFEFILTIFCCLLDILFRLYRIFIKPLVNVYRHRTQCIYVDDYEFFWFQDELEAELEELEAGELEEQLLQSATTAPAVSVQPTRPVMSTSDVDELTALQAEMAL